MRSIFIYFFCSIIFSLIVNPTKLAGLSTQKQITQYSIQRWDMESGLPGNSIYAIQQTRDGFLWIGTQNGLVRYNGVKFNIFTRDKNPTFKSNVIRSLFEDRDNNLWIGASSGGLIRYRKGKFTSFSDNRYKSLNNIRGINQDCWGNLWIGSLTEGLTCIDSASLNRLESKELKLINYTLENGLPNNQIRFMSRDKTGDLWITATTAILKLEKPGQFKTFASADILPYMKTAALYDADEDNLWIGTGEKGLFSFKEGNLIHYGTAEGIPHPTITYLYRDSKENLWIGTDGGGLTLLKKKVQGTLSNKNGLADGFVYSILEDREGSLWVGTLDGGLHQLIDNKFTTYTTREGLVHNYIESIMVNRENDIWIGTKGGLNKLVRGKVTNTITTASGLVHNTVLSLHEDPFGNTWIGTWGGLNRITGGKLSTLSTIGGLSDNRISAIATDKNGNTWIGTMQGLNRYGHKDKTITIYTRADGLLSDNIEALFTDRAGILWISTDKGLNIINNNTIDTFKFKRVKPVISFPIQCFYEDEEGTRWFGTNDGLIRVQKEDTFVYTIRSGLIENHITTILEGEKGYLWLGGRSGISRIKKEEFQAVAKGLISSLHPDLYNEMDGMKSRWCTGNACKTGNGLLCFPTSIGLTVMDSGHFTTNPHPPPIIIEKIIADGETVPLQGKLLENHLLKLKPGKKRVEFYYTAASYINPKKIAFKLKLEGYDTEWVDGGNLRNTTYTGLAPGKYTFRVTAANSDGIWNNNGASFSFYLQPFFYQTYWFYILIIIFITASLLSLHYIRLNRLRVRKEELRKLVQLRTSNLEERNIELERTRQKLQHSKELIEEKNKILHQQAEKLKALDRAKSHYFANISHEFRTPLTLIQGPLEQLLTENPDIKLKTRIHLMLRNSKRLLNLVDQLLELAKFDSGKMKLRASRQDIVRFLKNTVMCFESHTQQKKIDLLFQTESEELFLYFDQEKVERIMVNLISNAINFTPSGGKISVSLQKKTGEEFPGGSIKITVHDTGTGIPAHQLPHIFDRFYRGDNNHEYKRKGTGIGLALTKELVTLHHGTIEVRSICKPDPNQGTCFTLFLPIGEEHFLPDELVPDELVSDEVLPNETENKVKKPFNKSQINIEQIEAENAPAQKIKKEDKSFTLNSLPKESKQYKILIIDDNTDMRVYLRGALEPRFAVIEAINGKEGIKKAQKFIPDLVISDVMMPGIDGYTLCNRLKNDIKTSHIPIILLTARATEKSQAEGLETGADDYITKPFNAELLQIRIKNLIQLRLNLQHKFQQEKILQPGEVTVSSLDNKFLTDLQQVIEKNFEDPDFGVVQLTKKLHISHSTLYRKIEALTGKTPNLFIRSYRLKRATQLLKADYGNITEVALAVGFSSNAYFTKCFKEEYHQLPRKYAGDQKGKINKNKENKH